MTRIMGDHNRRVPGNNRERFPQGIKRSPMTEPEYKRPFEEGDFRGYFKWTRALSDALGGFLYHACHEDELRDIIDENELLLRSEWSLKLPHLGKCTAPGVWTGLNSFHRANFYGPFLIKFPLRVLNGRHFIAFRRKDDDDRNRIFFVQYEARIPVFRYEDKLWRNVDPFYYFRETAGGVYLKDRAIYDIVLTEPVRLQNAVVEAVTHRNCISRKCTGVTRRGGERVLKQMATKEIKDWLVQNEEYAALLKRFPILQDMDLSFG
jgi:hypothetical protein